MQYNSYYGQEFMRDTYTTAITVDNNASIGDDLGWYFDTTGGSYTQGDSAGGVARLITDSSGDGDYLALGEHANNLSTVFLKANRPVFMAKVKKDSTTTFDASHDFWIGLVDTTAVSVVENNAPANGVFFIASGTNNGDWYGEVKSGGARVGTPVSCGVGSISQAKFALLKFEVTDAATVTFYVDSDVSNGVSWTTCGTVTGSTNPTGALGLGTMLTQNTANPDMTVDIDFIRVWQDDTDAVPEFVETPTPTPTPEVASISEDYAAFSAITQVFPSELASTSAGSIVSVDPVADTFQAIKSEKEYDPLMVGVVVNDAGITLNNGTITKGVNVATHGRAKVKVSAENGQVKIGDYLTTSSKPGLAMRATKAGMVLGRAMTAQDTDDMVVVLIDTAWNAGDLTDLAEEVANPDAFDTAEGDFTVLGKLTIAGTTASASSIDVAATLESHEDRLLKLEELAASGSFDHLDMTSDLDIVASGTTLLLQPKQGFDTIAINAVSTIFKSIRSTGDSIADGVRKTYHKIMGTNAIDVANQSKLDRSPEGDSWTTYGVDSTRAEIQVSGSGTLVDGKASISFDSSFREVISATAPVRVILTATSPITIYVSSKSASGFEVTGTGVGTFDWLVIARRAGYEGSEAVTPTPEPTETLEPTPTPSGEPSISPTPEPTETLEPTPAPTETPAPSEDPTPTPTPDPTPDPTQ